MKLKVFPIPLIVEKIFFVLAIISVLLWIFQQVKSYARGEHQLTYNLFMISHFIVFSLGYYFIENINLGWLVINVWHNAQYLLFVWLYNNKKFKSGIDPKHKLISWLSQDNKVIHYFLGCFLLSTLFYFTTSKTLGLVSLTSLPLILIFYQTINFHHYVVDGFIWKIRKKPMQETLNI